ncbi:SDR family oxidoreductase [Bosea psychrotolerans]|uniref:NAD(P)-dependent dehydrogenase (Short-subunit alcohol dehydrogenase family) n=1 Tax=Bosea psychrotolerans TaxID=1871628 RepID=A0A2S4LY51_9HYPH|nr:SDR family oxidoreductase [Bosea psychrotolerans]POR47392.1 NAD(P)-dependent dehydrogenase (short-subunit alcohol dehydrogenase family) [Bosea psychrotolerans]
MKLAGKIAIITGGGSGIGHEAAKLFAAEGAIVIVADRDGAAAERVAAEITSHSGKASAHTVDVSKEAEIKAMIDRVVADHGRLDILVNNAGFGFAGTVVTTSEADWDALMAVNVKGVFFGCKHAIPVMEKQGGGVIVNTASAVANVGITDRAAYVASKGAVAALTRAMAIDHVAAKIRINCVAPGTIESPYFAKILSGPDGAELRRGLEQRQAMERLGQPVEIARAMLFLASDESSFCTGTTLVADGGWTAR